MSWVQKDFLIATKESIFIYFNCPSFWSWDAHRWDATFINDLTNTTVGSVVLLHRLRLQKTRSEKNGSGPGRFWILVLVLVLSYIFSGDLTTDKEIMRSLLLFGTQSFKSLRTIIDANFCVIVVEICLRKNLRKLRKNVSQDWIHLSIQ